jgi:hypothetical protein
MSLRASALVAALVLAAPALATEPLLAPKVLVVTMFPGETKPSCDRLKRAESGSRPKGEDPWVSGRRGTATRDLMSPIGPCVPLASGIKRTKRFYCSRIPALRMPSMMWASELR